MIIEFIKNITVFYRKIHTNMLKNLYTCLSYANRMKCLIFDRDETLVDCDFYVILPYVSYTIHQ